MLRKACKVKSAAYQIWLIGISLLIIEQNSYHSHLKPFPFRKPHQNLPYSNLLAYHVTEMHREHIQDISIRLKTITYIWSRTRKTSLSQDVSRHLLPRMILTEARKGINHYRGLYSSNLPSHSLGKSPWL